MEIKKLPPPYNIQNTKSVGRQSAVESMRYRIRLLERKLKRCTSPTSEARVCAAIAALCTQINNNL